MDAQKSAFKPAWWSIDLGNYRPCNSTYCRFEYNTLPPLDMSLFKGEFQWLTSTEVSTMEIYERDTPISKNLKDIHKEVQEKGLALPDEFVSFMPSSEAQKKIPSCTACFFTLSEKLIKNPLEDDSYFIEFYCDQQAVLMWYLYFNKAGEHCVVVSELPLDDEEEMQAIADHNERSISELVQDYVSFCAPTFESFIYRIWMENNLWFAIHEDENAEFTDAQKAYLKHYSAEE